MSRLMVKNIPKKTTAETLRTLFSTKGDVTEVSLKFRKDGVFRGFAFIGFKTAEQANAAKAYFHESFIQTSKIKVEICRALGSTDVKSWSKHTNNKQVLNKESSLGKNNKSSGTKKKKATDKLDGDPQFAEFLEIHRQRKAKPLWSNDGILPTKTNDQDSETGYSSSDCEQSQEKDSVEDGNVKPDIATLVTSTQKKKPKGSENTLIIRGLPKKVQRKDIKTFFAPYKYRSLRLPHNVNGVAYIQFENENGFKQSLVKNRGFLNGSRVTITEFTERTENESNNEKEFNEKNKAKNTDILVESGRIYVRNLTYTCTEEDLEAVFKPYGLLTEVHLPIDNFTKKVKGFAFITFMFPEHAVKAFEELDGTVFQGRVFHLIPARPAKKEENNVDDSFKDKKDQKMKDQSGSTHIWNTLFLGANAVADIMAEKYKTSKAKLLSSDKGESIAVRMALGETQIISETKDFLTENSVNLNAFETKNSERSKTVILVKNLAAKTSPSQLMPVFSKFGEVKQVILPPSGITAIVEFQNQTEAKTAFKNLAYTRFGSVPLYLEWAPVNVFTTSDAKSKDAEENTETKEEKETSVSEELDKEEDVELGSTLFVKNLNFDTVEEDLQSHFKTYGKIKSVTVAKKKDFKNPGVMLSMGYGFVQFKHKTAAQKALKELQHSKLDGHALELKISNRATNIQAINARKMVENKDTKTSKILVRNIPFEANKKEVSELFRVFGELKTVRMPEKIIGSGTHRGFGFIDFVTRADAKRAMESLKQSTHLYGRRLVLDWANTDDSDVDTLRRKTADTFQPGLSKSKKLKQNIQEDL